MLIQLNYNKINRIKKDNNPKSSQQMKDIKQG
jgi:hypothetical protein